MRLYFLLLLLLLIRADFKNLSKKEYISGNVIDDSPLGRYRSQFALLTKDLTPTFIFPSITAVPLTLDACI
jgi:hypothetical protein